MSEKYKTKGKRGFVDRAPIYDTTLIAAETHQSFERLHEELYEEYSPVGITEEHLVQRLAFLFLERSRLYRYLQFKMEDRQQELQRQFPAAQSIKRMKSKVRKAHQAALLSEAEEYLDEAEGITTQKTKKVFPANHLDSGGFLEHLPDRPTNGRELFSKLVEEFPIVERLKQLEQIDVAIDRTIKRLMQLKTMKQMYRQLEPTQVEHKVIEQPKNKDSRSRG
jgi:hypothetical protein